MPIHPHACAGPCANHARRVWTAYDLAMDVYRRAILDHADAVDAWAAVGEHGDPPIEPAEPEVPTIPVQLGEPHFCQRCVSLIAAALLDLDVLAAELEAKMDGHRTGVSEGRVSGSKTSGTVSPLRGILDRLYGDLTDAWDEWAQTCGYAPRATRRHRGSHARSQAIGWLYAHLGDMLRFESPKVENHVAWALGVLRWEKVLRSLAKEDPAGGKSPIRCPRCAERRVERERDGYWQCGSCGRLLNDTEEHELRDSQGGELGAETAQIAS